MPALPWQSLATTESDGEYLALLSYLPLNAFSAMPKFFRYTAQIRRQLADAEGLVGYSLEANILSREFRTLSVWRDEEALMEFVWSNPHDRIMEDLRPHMGQTEFIRWKVGGSSIPLDWKESKRRMRER